MFKILKILKNHIMNIAMFSDTFLPVYNGVSVEVSEMAEELAKRGHNVLIITIHEKKEELEKRKNYLVYKLKGNKFKIYEGFFYKLFMPRKKLKKILEEFKPDIIHVHSPFVVGYWGIITANKMKVPLISTYHTFLIQFVNEVLKSKSETKKRLLKFLFEKKPQQKITLKTLTKIGEPFANLVYKTSDMVIAPSKVVKKYLISKKIHDVTVIYNWVKNEKYQDLRNELRKKFGINKKDFVVLHVGRISAEKKIGIVIKSVSLLKNKIPSIKLIITSEGPFRKELEKMVRKNGLEKNVVFTGFLSNEELNSVYKLADVFASASPYDTFNLCVLRALKNGIPVIGTNEGGVGELIINGRNGYKIKENKKMIVNYAKKIEFLYKNAKIRKNLGKNAKKLSKKYSFKKSMDETLNIYGTAIKKGRNYKKIQQLIIQTYYRSVLSFIKIIKP